MSQPIQSYRDLRVWQMGMELAVECYQATKPFPREESFGLTSQIRRAAASIPANIAEGYARGSKDYLRFLRIAQGSLVELETHLMLSHKVELLPQSRLQTILERTDHLGRMLNKLQQSLGRD